MVAFLLFLVEQRCNELAVHEGPIRRLIGKWALDCAEWVRKKYQIGRR